VFKCQHDILISSLHEEDVLVRSTVKKQLSKKSLVHPSERGLTVVTAYYKLGIFFLFVSFGLFAFPKERAGLDICKQ